MSEFTYSTESLANSVRIAAGKIGKIEPTAFTKKDRTAHGRAILLQCFTAAAEVKKERRGAMALQDITFAEGNVAAGLAIAEDVVHYVHTMQGMILPLLAFLETEYARDQSEWIRGHTEEGQPQYFTMRDAARVVALSLPGAKKVQSAADRKLADAIASAAKPTA